MERDQRWIRIVKSRFTLILYRGNDVEQSYPIAVGRNGGKKLRSGDNRTPEGRFSIEKIHDASSWTHDFGDGYGAVRIGKKAAGRELDGKTWDEFPAP